MKKYIIILFLMVMSMLMIKTCYAEELEVKLDCYKVYEYDEDYNILSEQEGVSYDNLASRFSIKGDFANNGNDEKFVKFNVYNDNVSINYNYNTSFFDNIGSWELNPDEGSYVSIFCSKDNDEYNFAFDAGINSIFEDDFRRETMIYETKNFQLYTGCYYQIVVCYYLRKKIGEDKIGFITIPKYEKKHIEEEYYLYIANEDLKKQYIDKINRKPRMNLGKKVRVDGENYSEEQNIDSNDIHFGWDIGQFFVNGYTDKKEDNGEYVFLKNVGDRISLWFELKQNIYKLNENSNLSINYDNSGDSKFEEKIEGCGSLLIKAKDYENNQKPNIVYNDFLKAKTLTGANTEVNLFEEGDYEIALDYEIFNKDTLFGDTSNYTIPIKFKIRNGNCMIFPFDEVTGDELKDGAITKNGFHLDFAKSRYLDINVERRELLQREDSYKLDIRFNRPAKDGDKYIEEGIYTFKVKNKYTGEQIVKTIYVGDSDIYKTLSRYGYTIEELNRKLEAGYVINDGKFVKKEELQ